MVLLAGLGLGPLAIDAAGATVTPKRTTQSVKKPVKRYTVSKTTSLSRARRLRLASARARMRALQAREAAAPHFRLDADGKLVPDVRAEAAIIYNPENGQILWEENSQSQRSIASITKVMTAAVLLENDPDLNQEVLVDRSDVRAANTTYLRTNERITVGDLLHLLLIASDNAAARALARTSEYGTNGFVGRMNQTASELGLENTHYTDPSGLDPANVSSAYDMARLIAYASADERIASVMRTPEYIVRTNRRSVTIHSTNQLVRAGDVDVRAGKTGFITKAGYCLATLLRLPQGNQQVAVVVLGARSNAGRFMETRHLFNWLSLKTQDFFAKPTESQ